MRMATSPFDLSLADVLRSGGSDDPITGELGIKSRPDGGGSSEISITVTDPRLNGGRPTNIPLLVQGQTGVNDLLAGKQWTPEQEDIAVRRAMQRSYGRAVPSYGTIPEAVDAARARSDAGGSARKFGAQERIQRFEDRYGDSPI